MSAPPATGEDRPAGQAYPTADAVADAVPELSAFGRLAVRRGALLTACAYLCVALAWIWWSDIAAQALAPSVEALTRFQSIKGTLFVALTAVALYSWLRYFFRLARRAGQVELRLHDTEAQFRSLAELAPEGIVVHDSHGILYANPAFRRALGLAPDAPVAGLRLRELVAPAQLEWMRERIDRLAGEPCETSPVEVTLHTRDGRAIEVEHVGSSVKANGRIVVLSHLRDVTARNLAVRELERVNTELEASVLERTAALRAANHALESFTYSVAHDLRSPVAHVDGFAKALQEAVAQGKHDKLGHYAQRIVANAELMGQMIEGLLQLSRADRIQLESADVDMGALVNRVVGELDEAVRGTITVDPLPTVRGDAAGLRHVWANLLSNAVKYSATAAAPSVHVGAAEEDGTIVFSVQDNGVGFDPAEADRLFGLFQRLGTGRDFPGTGVGLTIVKRIVERHGGRVWATGQVGEGAVFRFALPAPAAQPGDGIRLE